MASKKVVVDGETKDEVDKVTDIKFESEDDDGNRLLPHHSSEILDTDIDEEIKLFLNQELTSEQDVSEDGVTLKRNTNEKSPNVTDTGTTNVAGLVSECKVMLHRVDDSSEKKQSSQIENNVPEKRNDQTEILSKKRLRDTDVKDEKEIDYGLGIESGANSLESTEHSDSVSESKTKTDRNAFDLKAKDGAEAKSLETTSGRTCVINGDLSPLWNSYILAVNGIPPKESGRLKQVLNDVLGSNRHRVRPRQKGDTIVYLHFITLEDMTVAKETLTTQGVAKYKLTVTVESADEHKSKSDDGNEGPASKKMRHQPVLQFYEEDYDKQIEFKVKDVTSRLQYLGKDILKVYPTYSSLIRQRRLQHDGAICAVDRLKDCPASKREASSCWFAVGLSEETGQLALGIHQGTGHVRKLSSVKHNYPDHVVKAAEVFEQFLLAEECRKICRKVLITTNRMQDLMLLVFVHDTSHVKQVSNEMKEFFTSGDGAKCKVTSMHVKVVKSNWNELPSPSVLPCICPHCRFLDLRKLLVRPKFGRIGRSSLHGSGSTRTELLHHNITDGDMQLAVGVQSLRDTVAGLELQLPPVKNLWNTIHGAEMLCQALEELLAPSKETTVLDIGCGIGLLGLYLSKKAGEVLGVDTNVAVDVATKNATLNGITHCSYFAGDTEVMIPELAKKIKYDSVRAVMTCCINNSYRSGKAMEELRKIQHLDRLVLVEDRTMSSTAILSLNKPSSDKKMGNPFFPSKVVPVDCLPNSKGYVLLVLLERVSTDDIQKFGIDSKSVATESELRTKGGASRKPYERDSRLRLKQGDRRLWDRGAFSQQRYDAHAGAMQRCQTADVPRAFVGAANSLTNVANEYELRRHMEEDYRRQMIEEEEHRQWLAKEEERRLMEEMHLRQIQEEDWIRWVHDEQMKRIQEEECGRNEEEEWRRRIEEERMRQIQEERMRELQEEEWRRRIEEERMRQIQEERMRELQEEEERMRQIQEEERMRQIQEERMRELQEEEWRRRIEEEERMRQIQEERMRELQEEEEERMRQIQEEERMRRIQEEWMRQNQEEEKRIRQIQEKRMREIQAEEDRMRQVKEERMKQIEEERMRRMREIQEEKERMMQIQEERMRQIQEEERMRQIQEEERMRLMRKIQEEERMQQIQEERMRQIHEAEHMRQIQEEEYRRTEEGEWRRQVSEVEWRRQMQEEQRRIKEEDWRRQIQEDDRRKQIQKEEQRRAKEEEWRRKIQRESQKRPVLEEKCSEKMVEEEQLRRPVKEERERELVRGSVVRSRNDLVQDLLADSLRAAAIPQLSADATQKVKHLVAGAIRTVGTKEQGERPGGRQNREVGGISREDKTVSRFGKSDKEISQSRHMEEEYLRYIREVESAYDHSHDVSGGAVGRYGSEQNDLKAQHQAVGIKSTEKLPSLLDLKLKHPDFKVESSYSALHSEDRGGDTNHWQTRLSIVEKGFDSQAQPDRPTDRSFNHGNQARDLVRRDGKSTFSGVTENTADIYLRRGDLDQEQQRSFARRGDLGQELQRSFARRGDLDQELQRSFARRGDMDQEQQRSFARRDRMDIQGASNRNVIGRPEHSWKDRRHTVSGRPPTRPWLDSN